MTDWSWKERIVAMLSVRDQLYKADKDELWEYHFPEVAANMSDISDIQEKLGVSFSDDYIDLLLCADGWQCFYQDVDLFGTKDYETEKFTYAKTLLNVEAEYDEELRKLKDHLLPIAVSKTDKDLFVMILKEGEDHGTVIWLAGGEIERFDSFGDFFEAMIEYNKEDLEELLEDD